MSMLDAATVAHFDALFRVDGIDGAAIARSAANCEASIIVAHVDQTAARNQDYVVEADDVDLIIKAAQYKPTGSVSAPALDDRITADVLGLETTWRVIVRGDRCYRNMDAKGTYLRVFAKAL